MLILNVGAAIAAYMTLLLPGTTCADPVLERQDAAIGAPYKAIMRVPHGCDGSPTNCVQVQYAQHGGHGQPSRQHDAKARTYKVGDLVIEAPWSRATPGGARVGAGFLRITNNGKTADRLVDGTFAAAKKFEVHEMKKVDDVMKMRRLAKGLEIKPGETVELKPSSYHVMFFDLTRPLKVDDVVKGTLRFERAGTVEVEYRVAPIGAQPDGQSQGGHKHH